MNKLSIYVALVEHLELTDGLLSENVERCYFSSRQPSAVGDGQRKAMKGQPVSDVIECPAGRNNA